MIDVNAAAAILEEAAFEPHHLASALERAGRILNFDHFYLVRMEPDRPEFIGGQEFQGGVKTYIHGGWWEIDDRTQHCRRVLRPNTIIREQSIYSEEKKAKSVICNEFFRPLGWDWLAGWQVNIANETWGLAGMRADRLGPVRDDEATRLAAFMPVANRAVQMAVQLRDAQFSGTADGIEAAGFGAIILDHNGRVSLATRNSESLFGPEFGVRRGHLWAADGESNRALTALSHQAKRGEPGKLTEECIIRRQDGRKPIIVRPVPVRGRILDTLPGACLVLMLTDLEARPRVDASQLRRLFGLTPREAEIAALIAEGVATSLISEQLNLKLLTIRDYVKSVLAKTGCNRQSELAAVLARVRNGLNSPSK